MLTRLLGIIYILMNKGTVTAGELAQRYEVSVRTIYRDVDTLAMAGIPIYTRKGKNGGVSLTEQFVLDKMLVTREEQQQILAALFSLEEVGAQEEKETLQKLGEFFQMEPKNWVSIDLSDWSGRRQELVNQLKQAILQHRLLQFDYYGQNGTMSQRTAEPVQMVFKEHTWYLSAYCHDRQAMRMFKVLRMKRLKVLDQTFLPEDDKYRKEAVEWAEGGGSLTELTLRISASEAYRIYDRFEEEEIMMQEDGSFLVRMSCILDEWIYGMIFSFGPAAVIVEPAEVKKEARRRLQQMLDYY